MLTKTEYTDPAAGGFYEPELCRQMLTQVPAVMAMLRWREGICQVYNPMFSKLWGNRALLDKPMREAWPEMEATGYFETIERVYDSGTPVHVRDYAAIADWNNDGIPVEHFFDLTYCAYRNTEGHIEGVIITGSDVTERHYERNALAEQQRLFKDITDAAGTALWTVDTNGNITFVNQTWIDWTGQPYEAHMGRGWIDFVIPHDRERVMLYLRELNRRKPFEVDFRVVRSDGKIQWLAANGKPRYSLNGDFAGYVGSCMDITARKKTEHMLKESEERFRSIANSAPVLIWMADSNKQTKFLNKGWLKFAHIDDLLSDDRYMQGSLVHPEDRDRVLNIYNNAFDNRREFYVEYRMEAKDGHYHWVGMKGVPRISADDVFEGYIGSGMDITEMKEHEQIKNDFIGMASHELKTPITSIKAYVQLLLSIYSKNLLDEDEFLINSLTTVNKQINKLTRLITDLLDVSKMESGRLSLNCATFGLKELLKETIDEVQYTASHHTITLEQNEDINLQIYADRDRIAQVIINFLTNAIKYSPQSDKIDVVMQADQNDVIISVRDYGIGISAEEQSKVFNRFYRVEGRNEQTFSGFGIGLYIAAEIVKRHHGRIWVKSERNVGSTFYFSLPLHKPEV